MWVHTGWVRRHSVDTTSTLGGIEVFPSDYTRFALFETVVRNRNVISMCGSGATHVRLKHTFHWSYSVDPSVRVASLVHFAQRPGED